MKNIEAQWKISNRLDKQVIAKLEAAIAFQHKNIEGILILQDNELLYEKYYHNTHREDKFHVASVTKSVLSILVGIALDKGFLKSIDEKVMSFFPEYDFHDRNRFRKQVSIRHLLTMTAPFPFPNMQEPLYRICHQLDWVKYALDMLGEGGKLGEFKYATAGSHILSAIITKCTHMSAREFANVYLFEPLQIGKIPDYPMQFDLEHLFGEKVRGWVSDPNQNSAGGWGITLTVREMAKIGLLFQNKGRWNEKQVVSEAWVMQSTTCYGNDYGYLWWMGENLPPSTFLAQGSGGNVICVIPESKITIAIASTIIQKPADRQLLIKEYILPYI